MPFPVLRQVIQEDLFKEAKAVIGERIADRRKNYLVGVSGINCAGKSTLAQSLSREPFGFPGRPCLFDIDDFLYERKVRNANPDQVAGCYGCFRSRRRHESVPAIWFYASAARSYEGQSERISGRQTDDHIVQKK